MKEMPNCGCDRPGELQSPTKWEWELEYQKLTQEMQVLRNINVNVGRISNYVLSIVESSL